MGTNLQLLNVQLNKTQAEIPSLLDDNIAIFQKFHILE